MFKNILFYNSGGGIGDAIQILPLINTFKKEFESAEIHYLCSHENHFNSTLKDLNSQIDTLDLKIKYFGFRWWHSLVIKKKIKKYNIKKFDLIIDLQSKLRNSLILKMLPHTYFISSCFNFKLSKPKVKVANEKRINNKILNAVNFAFNKNYKLLDFNMQSIDKKIFEESIKLLPKNNYIGFSITQGNVYRKKEWPVEKIIKIANEFTKKNKVPVFFIEKKFNELINTIKDKVPEALFPEHKSSFNSPALVACLAKRLDLAITIDNGIMHMLSLSKVPIISLFGPTDPEKFAPQYKNSKVLDSKKIYNSNDVSKITVEDVLQESKQLLNF
tara:strand:- start:2514 stop:3503 length:990 start_codon:yes stop_codon:yes gene_type:complete